MRLYALFASLVAMAASLEVAVAAPNDTLSVWPGQAPGETANIGPERLAEGKDNTTMRVTDVSEPTLAIFQPPKDKNTGAAVVICPGGGYSILAYDKEGTEVAEWLNSIGVTGIVLKYRVPKRAGDETHRLPLADAQRAVSIVRGRASEWGVDPDRIGILGFSAGGNLAALTMTSFDERAYKAIDSIDDISCRPDFGILIYGAYLSQDGELSPLVKVTKETPPTFFVHADDDRVSAEGSALLYVALKRAGVNAEVHIYANGGHGFGLRPSEDAVSTWPARCEAWMKAKGLWTRK